MRAISRGAISLLALNDATPAGPNIPDLTATGPVNITGDIPEGYAISISGTWAGTCTFQGSVDGVNFAACAVTPLAGGADVTSTTVNGQWRLTTNRAGLQFRVQKTAHTSGAPIVTVVELHDSIRD